ncbi:hypothetical protein CHGG_10419 [Chaetomium globosum CBS 148.51]|uniref:phenylalanine--tRNA ligase n=1 Tax=Chaetomium globosum (strain ATCC 6205 / CBS 148.51 / DSM 1962 / NBRC 6347 / NRRL 1970) TaxID=306901 RepID=Q2GNN5_CHAGB|nr:uncharacterized protein CHGG_10419 [Chaetomium globosum CBS 148.51]EAQ84015.1 hypothetical protein CHGG_10419 [Chaetomium globosum CBS 148.51]
MKGRISQANGSPYDIETTLAATKKLDELIAKIKAGYVSFKPAKPMDLRGRADVRFRRERFTLLSVPKYLLETTESIARTRLAHLRTSATLWLPLKNPSPWDALANQDPRAAANGTDARSRVLGEDAPPNFFELPPGGTSTEPFEERSCSPPSGLQEPQAELQHGRTTGNCECPVASPWESVQYRAACSTKQKTTLWSSHVKSIESVFPRPTYKYYNEFDPVVSTYENFDSLGFPPDHPGRARTDTYYINKDTLLRTHTSAHEAGALPGERERRMEGARVWDRTKVPNGDLAAAVLADLDQLPKHNMKVEDPNPPFHPERNPLQAEHHTPAEAAAVAAHLKRSLELMQALHANAGRPSQMGWAFGIGLERIAMLLFRVPDIRLFWSRDERFLAQFQGLEDAGLEGLRLFVPFSKYPACYKDVSFWLGGGGGTGGEGGAEWHENDLMEVVRDAAGDCVEDVSLVDEFTHPKTGRRSMCYRINYRSLEKTLTNTETNEMHDRVVKGLVGRLGVEIR